MADFTIQVDDGRIYVPIRNTHGEEIGAFYFNPADMGIISRYHTLMEELPKVIEKIEIDTDTMQSTGESIEQVEEKVYKLINTFLASEDAATAFFGKVSPLALCNGKLYLENVLNAVGVFIDKQFDVQTKKFSAKVSKYTKGLKE